MAGEDPDFCRWVRARACVLATHGCSGGIEAHHAGRERGMGQRDDDSTCIPLCRVHHAAWHDLGPPFRAMTKTERRVWAIHHIQRTQKLYADSLGPSEIPF